MFQWEEGRTLPSLPLFLAGGGRSGGNTCKMCLNQILFQNNNVDLEHFEPQTGGDIVPECQTESCLK